MIQSNNTVQDLTTTSGVTVDTVSVTSGFNVVGDGGGGNFIWKTIAVYGPRPSADGGIIVYSTADATGWWERQFEFADIRFWGGKADVKVLNDANMTASSAVLTSASANFTAKDIGKKIYVVGVGATALTLTATITAYTSATQVTLSVAASTTASNTPATYGTDSTNAFTNINNYGRSLVGKSLQIVLQSGTYMTNFNNWLAGIRSVEVIGNGANIMCTHGAADPNGYAFNQQALNMPSVFDTFDNTFYNGSATPYVYGDLIASTVSTSASSAQSVTTLTATDAANYTPGTWALIYGFEHENIPGFPPDARYYDYVKVVTADAATGIITFDRALNYEYDAGWPDNLPGGGVGGAPRIISCTRSNFQTIEDLVIRDLSLVPFNGWVSPNAALRTARLSVYGYINARFYNVNCGSVYPGQGKNLLFDTCQFSKACEPDKLIDQLIFKNTSFVDVVNGGGVNFLQMLNCTFSGQFNISPRYLDIDNCTFASTSFGSSSALAFFGQNKGVEHVRLGTNVWNCSLPGRSALIANSNNTILTVDTVVNNTLVLVTNAHWITATNGRQVLPGSIGYTSTNKRFIVKRVYAYDANNVGIVGDFSQVPVVGDVFKFIYVRRISVEGRQHKIGANANNYQLFLTEDLFPQIQYRENTPAHDLKRILLTDQDITQGNSANVRSAFGYPCRLIVNVIKAYTGTDTNALLKLVSYTTGTFTQTIDLKTTGTRIAEIGRHAGGVGADVLVDIDPSYMPTFRFYWAGVSAGTLTATDSSQLPIVQIYFETFELIR
ncbi:hypothetical protein SAMN05428975_3576 [Mucilaginibacter sp. OK268]|uniref:hypothetical protein n=1 Tax=Mucilaginibacter sp. OK268 TaxID=1881048 RepID=UPI00088B5974|nr:hypothetical protein [Mucilaginibacter sp. OK268]SDP91590.1 hypothetical protein SAMN05428975_3576 [Mucilaginibacter sp. OK268]